MAMHVGAEAERALDVVVQKLNTKGSDASNLHDEELPLHEQEFSDDEQEALARRARNAKSRGRVEGSSVGDTASPRRRRRAEGQRRHAGRPGPRGQAPSAPGGFAAAAAAPMPGVHMPYHHAPWAAPGFGGPPPGRGSGRGLLPRPGPRPHFMQPHVAAHGYHQPPAVHGSGHHGSAPAVPNAPLLAAPAPPSSSPTVSRPVFPPVPPPYAQSRR